MGRSGLNSFAQNPMSYLNANTSTSDNFIRIPVRPSNIDRWIIRSSILAYIKQRACKLSGRVLDVGCGRMPYRRLLLDAQGIDEYVGLDIDGALDYGSEDSPDVRWDGRTMPFADDTFDSAMLTEVLEHVPDVVVLLNEVRRVLRPGGAIFFTTPFIWPYHETPHDHRRLTVFGLEHQLKLAGYTDIQIDAVGDWHSSLAQFIGLYVARAPMPWVVRKLSRLPAFAIQMSLMWFAAPKSNPGENSMPRMLAGTATCQ